MLEKRLYITKVNMSVTENRQLVEFYGADQLDSKCLGRVYVGKVGKLLPGMNAAFVDIGQEKLGYLPFKNVFFKDNDIQYVSIEDCLKVGQEIIVQVIKEGVDEKGPKLTTDIAITGRRVILLPVTGEIKISSKIKDTYDIDEIKDIIPDDMGCIVRTDAANASIDEIEKEIIYLKNKWDSVEKDKGSVPREIYSEDSSIIKFIIDNMDENTEGIYTDNVEIAEYIRDQFIDRGYMDIDKVHYYSSDVDMLSCMEIDSQYKKLSGRKVWLKSGGYLVIDKTEALTVIDVNTGKYTGGNSFDNTIVDINCEAADMAARVIRLNDIGGIILIDFLTMKRDEDKEKVLNVLKKRIKNDKIKTKVYGFTKLGLVEISRKRR